MKFALIIVRSRKHSICTCTWGDRNSRSWTSATFGSLWLPFWAGPSPNGLACLRPTDMAIRVSPRRLGKDLFESKHMVLLKWSLSSDNISSLVALCQQVPTQCLKWRRHFSAQYGVEFAILVPALCDSVLVRLAVCACVEFGGRNPHTQPKKRLALTTSSTDLLYKQKLESGYQIIGL